MSTKYNDSLTEVASSISLSWPSVRVLSFPLPNQYPILMLSLQLFPMLVLVSPSLVFSSMQKKVQACSKYNPRPGP